jgi:hypothetical protein
MKTLDLILGRYGENQVKSKGGRYGAFRTKWTLKILRLEA